MLWGWEGMLFNATLEKKAMTEKSDTEMGYVPLEHSKVDCGAVWMDRLYGNSQTQCHQYLYTSAVY